MKKGLLIWLSVMIVAGLVACSQKKVGPGPEQQVTTPAESTMKQSEMVTEKQPALMAKQEEVSSPIKMQEGVSSAFNEIKTLQAMVQDIYFAFNEYDLSEESKASMRKLASMLSKNKYRVVIEGHCDERGTPEYNLALGDKRASAAKQYLVALGIQPFRIETVSYGKEKPLCTESHDSCWAKNRRDHFVIGEAGK